MNLFLTSSPCDDRVPPGVALPCVLDEANGFVRRLRAVWKPDARLTVVCADPHNAPLNDEMLATFCGAFAYHGLRVSRGAMLDARNERDASALIAVSDAVLLAGGHVPTQLAFFEQIGLRALLSRFTGTVIGVSAGSMNAARVVYAQPELPGETLDPAYERFVRGLGLTDVMILPHLQKVRWDILDGKRLFEDVTFGDSFGRRFIAIPDGSYVYARDGVTTLCGEGWLIADGKMEKICENGRALAL